MPPEPTPTRSSALREILGLVLILVGAVTLCATAFLVDVRLGCALLGAMAAGAGSWLTIGEE